jgi:hypothetical protein
MKRLDLIQKEIENHFKVLEAVARELENIELDKEEFSIDELKTIDTFIFRFLKLQSAMGEKLFPLFFEYLTGKSHTDVVFLDILNTFEKYRILDADEWKEIRKLRDVFMQIYPWEIEEQLKLIQLALKKLKSMKNVYFRIKKLIKREKEIMPR